MFRPCRTRLGTVLVAASDLKLIRATQDFNWGVRIRILWHLCEGTVSGSARDHLAPFSPTDDQVIDEPSLMIIVGGRLQVGIVDLCPVFAEVVGRRPVAGEQRWIVPRPEVEKSNFNCRSVIPT